MVEMSGTFTTLRKKRLFLQFIRKRVLERMLTAAGENSFKQADEYAKENKAFVFAFEINASFYTGSGRRRGRGRPLIYLKLESYLIKRLFGII